MGQQERERRTIGDGYSEIWGSVCGVCVYLGGTRVM